MTIIFISDTHTQHWDGWLNRELEKLLCEYPEAVLVHCGDISSRGRQSEVEDFIEWYESLKFKSKLLIAGNHDFMFEDNPEEALRILETKGKSIIYLNDSGTEIDGVKFWGSPVTPRFFDWAFNRDADIQKHWNMIPHDTNVLVTHGPPYGILDFTARDRKPVGCHYLRRRLFDLKDLKVHSFGHIHEGFGNQIGDDVDFDGVHFVNASYLNLSYTPVNHPVVINI
jgi:Icc-related predicted phosphoesterase